MLTPVYATQFRKDYKLCKKRGYEMPNITAVMLDLQNEAPLQPKHKEHLLQGAYKGFSELHVEPDWLLIYKTDRQAGEIYFARTGTHADLFD